jgi:hypothetical protein
VYVCVCVCVCVSRIVDYCIVIVDYEIMGEREGGWVEERKGGREEGREGEYAICVIKIHT